MLFFFGLNINDIGTHIQIVLIAEIDDNPNICPIPSCSKQ